MSEYAADINTDLYKSNARMYIQEITGISKTFLALKINLNENNFNFSTARTDGLDLRFALAQNGTGVLQMWIAYWNYSNQKATIYLKLPELAANETKTVWVYWGNESDAGISDLYDLTGDNGSTAVFLFGEGFDGALDVPTTLAIHGVTGTAFSSGSLGAYPPEGAFDGDIGGPGQSWFSQSAGTVYIGFNFNTPPIINKVRTYTWQNDWYDLVIEASNNLAGPYTVLYTYSSIPPNNSWSNYYNFTNTTAYKYYRFRGTCTSPDVNVHVIEIEMFTTAGYKWFTPGTNYSISDSAINLGLNAYIECEGPRPLKNIKNWIVEEGITGIGNPSTTSIYAHRYNFYGGQNPLGIRYYWEGSIDRRHDFVIDNSYINYPGIQRGLEIDSYSQNYIAYYESTDKVYQGMANRATYNDYNDDWERQVHRNTLVEYFRIYGENDPTADGVNIDWVIAREYEPETDPTLDLSELWIPYTDVPHQQLDFTEYASNITSVDFYHSSDMGGDPYLMSDNLTDSLDNIFISDNGTVSGSLIIDFGRGRYSLADKTYLHLDNNHVDYYNAAKLSDNDIDEHNRNYWLCTTNSDVWAAIKFPNKVAIGCFTVKAVSSKLNGMIKHYKIYGTNYDPRLVSAADKKLLTSGQFAKTTSEQPIYITDGRAFFYYILEAEDSYGDNIALQEWGMYQRFGEVGKRAISQIRLHPVDFNNNESYFPKSIEFYGSNDGLNWTQILAETETATPFYDYTYGRWQRHSFDNYAAYYQYKLICIGNWYATINKIMMAEWEMVEKILEQNNYRILAGTTNNINNIWAASDFTITSGTVYITNDYFNTVHNDILVASTTISGIDDMNVI